MISCEMVEAVGKAYMERWWEVVDWILTEVDGVAVVQGITLPEGRVEGYDRSVDFIQKWVRETRGLVSTMKSLSDATMAGWLLHDKIFPGSYSKSPCVS